MAADTDGTPCAAEAPAAPASAAPSRSARRSSAAADDGRAALIPYAVAGYPDAETSERIAIALIDSGADLLEIGLPYSDPLADGLTLQRASAVALAAGATLDRSIALVAAVHRARPDVPLVPMGYVNQVLGGRDRTGVLDRLADAGASGLILADLTPDEAAEIEEHARARGLSNIYLVTPTTPPDRRRMIAERSTGLPLRRLPGRRHRCADVAAAGRRRVPAPGSERVARSGRRRLRRLEARACAEARQGGRRDHRRQCAR